MRVGLAAGNEQCFAIGPPGDAIHVAASIKRMDDLASCQIPNPHQRFVPPSGQPVGISGTERQAMDFVAAVFEDAERLQGRRIP